MFIYPNNNLNNGEQMIINNIYKYFHPNLGFGKYEDIAFDLFKKVIDILNTNNIDYFIISGTLLGFLRHNNFIPWDDDIDIIVDSKILNHLYLFNNDEINYYKLDGLIKCCFKNKSIPIKCSFNNDNCYHFPFIDMFTFNYTDDKANICFFNKEWLTNKFYPSDKVLFNNKLLVNIPFNPHYFLQRNYTGNYMKQYRSNRYSHKYNKLMYFNESFMITDLLYNKYINFIDPNYIIE